MENLQNKINHLREFYSYEKASSRHHKWFSDIFRTSDTLAIGSVQIGTFIIKTHDLEGKKIMLSIFQLVSYVQTLEMKLHSDDTTKSDKSRIKSTIRNLIKDARAGASADLYSMITKMEKGEHPAFSNLNVESNDQSLDLVHTARFVMSIQDGESLRFGEYVLPVSKSEEPIATFFRLFIVFLNAELHKVNKEVPHYLGITEYGETRFILLKTYLSYFSTGLAVFVKHCVNLDLTLDQFRVPKATFFKIIAALAIGTRDITVVKSQNDINSIKQSDIPHNTIIMSVDPQSMLALNVKVSCDHCHAKHTTSSIAIAKYKNKDVQKYLFFDPLCSLTSRTMADGSNIPLWTQNHNSISKNEAKRLNKFFLSPEVHSIPQMCCGMYENDGKRIYIKYLSHHYHPESEDHAHMRLSTIFGYDKAYILSSDMYAFDNAASFIRNRLTVFIDWVTKFNMNSLNPNFAFFNTIDFKIVSSNFSYMAHGDLAKLGVITKVKLCAIRSMLSYCSDSTTSGMVDVVKFIYHCLITRKLCSINDVKSRNYDFKIMASFFSSVRDREKEILFSLLRFPLESIDMLNDTNILMCGLQALEAEGCGCDLCKSTTMTNREINYNRAVDVILSIDLYFVEYVNDAHRAQIIPHTDCITLASYGAVLNLSVRTGNYAVIPDTYTKFITTDGGRLSLVKHSVKVQDDSIFTDIRSISKAPLYALDAPSLSLDENIKTEVPENTVIVPISLQQTKLININVNDGNKQDFEDSIKEIEVIKESKNAPKKNGKTREYVDINLSAYKWYDSYKDIQNLENVGKFIPLKNDDHLKRDLFRMNKGLFITKITVSTNLSDKWEDFEMDEPKKAKSRERPNFRGRGYKRNVYRRAYYINDRNRGRGKRQNSRGSSNDRGNKNNVGGRGQSSTQQNRNQNANYDVKNNKRRIPVNNSINEFPELGAQKQKESIPILFNNVDKLFERQHMPLSNLGFRGNRNN